MISSLSLFHSLPLLCSLPSVFFYISSFLLLLCSSYISLKESSPVQKLFLKHAASRSTMAESLCFLREGRSLIACQTEMRTGPSFFSAQVDPHQQEEACTHSGSGTGGGNGKILFMVKFKHENRSSQVPIEKCNM